MNSTSDYKAKICETHHTEKLDAPSGTAVKIAEDILGYITEYTGWSKGNTNEDDKLPVFSDRIGNIVGIHSVKYESDLDFIEIKHNLKDRSSLAKGAVMAAEYVLNKQGYYTMDNLLS